MSTKPQKVSLKERLAATSAKRDEAMAPKRDDAMSTSGNAAKESERDGGMSSSSDVVKLIALGKVAPKTLPKVTLYAHEKVLKAIRLVAVEDGVQAQEILRAAVRDYLATRGHHFTDLTTGK